MSACTRVLRGMEDICTPFDVFHKENSTPAQRSAHLKCVQRAVIDRLVHRHFCLTATAVTSHEDSIVSSFFACLDCLDLFRKTFNVIVILHNEFYFVKFCYPSSEGY